MIVIAIILAAIAIWAIWTVLAWITPTWVAVFVDRLTYYFLLVGGLAIAAAMVWFVGLSVWFMANPVS